MSEILPPLRMNLDFMPSPVPDRPGLLIRDSYRYSDATLLIPPVLVQCLQHFDGEHSTLDLRASLVQLTGELEVGQIAQHLVETLSQSGFLEDENFARMREGAEQAFAESNTRLPIHAGTAYPDEPGALRDTMHRYLGRAEPAPTDGKVVAIAAPHVSPEGGWNSYRAAYNQLAPSDAERTFVILGTSHYGQPERFGLTRKPFVTPLGETQVDHRLLAELAGQPAVLMEDYCHAIEHSIEFQVLFLQALYGPDIKILPILCGSFARSLYNGGPPEADDNVKRFLGGLGEIAAREGDHLLWVLGVDMAHIGRRYGDSFDAIANQAEMAEVAERDHRRLERLSAGDAAGFWDLVRQNRDDLRWCGSAPLYSFLHAVPQAQGTLHHYEQWNIDERSVVSFAGISFR